MNKYIVIVEQPSVLKSWGFQTFRQALSWAKHKHADYLADNLNIVSMYIIESDNPDDWFADSLVGSVLVRFV